MNETLKITSVLSDPTRYFIYQYINGNREEVSVQEIAEQFQIHPNVARLHLTKLEEVKLLVSETQKTGKGGRPGRLYRLSEELIQLHFPFRDYQLLAQIGMEAIFCLGNEGAKAFKEAGFKFGQSFIESLLSNEKQALATMDSQSKIEALKNACISLGFYPVFKSSDDTQSLEFHIYNCPFKEVAKDNHKLICKMHGEFVKGMVQYLLPDARVQGQQKMFHCNSKFCAYEVEY